MIGRGSPGAGKGLRRRDLLRSGAALAGSLLLGCERKQSSRVPSSPEPDPGAAGETWPVCLKLHRRGGLKKQDEERMKPCKLCPRTCGVDRIGGKKGFCNAPAPLEISSFHPHFGEERPLVGRGGSGTIFFTHCGRRCVFCINHEISLEGKGHRGSIEELAGMMLHLREIGCVNINLVTPTHYAPHILLALDLAAGQGLRLPLVYNTCRWENLEILKKLDGVVDIYLPDMKYADGAMALKYSSCAPRTPRPRTLRWRKPTRPRRPTRDSHGPPSSKCIARRGWPGPTRMVLSGRG